MTALELAVAGVRVERTKAGLRVLAPKGREDLVEELRRQVARRVPELGGETMKRRENVKPGECECCGDRLANGRGGMCDLCIIGRSKALLNAGTRPTW